MSSSFVPHYSPLLVRSPNLNAWLSNTDAWLYHWTYQELPLGLNGLIRIDGATIPWMGQQIYGIDTPKIAEQIMTPTSTVLKFKTNGIDLDVTFLNPIEPENIILQSFPFTYISVDVKSNDGRPHSVQIFLDIQGQWLSYDNSANLTIHAEPGQAITFLQGAPAGLPSEPTKASDNRRPEDVTLYFGMATEPSSTYQAGAIAREGFLFQGRLNNTGDTPTNYPLQNGTDLASFSLSKDLGDVSTDTASNALFAIGLVRDPSIAFTPSRDADPEIRHPCFRAVYDGVGPALKDFIADYSSARDRAAAFDERMTNAARQVSEDVADLVAMTTRLVMASMDVTCGSDASDIMFFVNGMGTVHESLASTPSYSNRVDDLYASWPAIMSINATYGRYMLEPLLRFQKDSSQAYAIPDLGQYYPIIDGGYPTSEWSVHLGFEESGNMLLMAWAQVRFSGESYLVDNYYEVFKRWADYLPNHIPLQGFAKEREMLSSDGLASNNANLALKGILGVRAMAELAAIKMETDASQKYFTQSQEMYQAWINASFAGDHLRLDYQAESWGLMYNMYADRWLGLNVIAEDIYQQQETFYASQHIPDYGIQYDSQNQDVKPHWTAFTAGIIENSTLRDKLMSTVHRYAVYPETPFVQNMYALNTDDEKPNDGHAQRGALSSTWGSTFAIQARSLVAKRQVQRNISDSDGTGKLADSKHKSTNTGAIVGGVVGGAGVIALSIILCFLWRHRQRRQRQLHVDSDMCYDPAVTPFNPNILRSGSAGSILNLKSSKGAAQHAKNSPSDATTTTLQPRQDTSLGPHPVSMVPNPHDSSLPDLHAEINQLRNDVQHILSTYDPPPHYE